MNENDLVSLKTRVYIGSSIMGSTLNVLMGSTFTLTNSQSFYSLNGKK